MDVRKCCEEGWGRLMMLPDSRGFYIDAAEDSAVYGVKFCPWCGSRIVTDAHRCTTWRYISVAPNMDKVCVECGKVWHDAPMTKEEMR